MLGYVHNPYNFSALHYICVSLLTLNFVLSKYTCENTKYRERMGCCKNINLNRQITLHIFLSTCNLNLIWGCKHSSLNRVVSKVLPIHLLMDTFTSGGCKGYIVYFVLLFHN